VPGSFKDQARGSKWAGKSSNHSGREDAGERIYLGRQRAAKVKGGELWWLVIT